MPNEEPAIPWTAEELSVAHEAFHAVKAALAALEAQKLAAEAHSKILAAINLSGPISLQPGGEDRIQFVEKLHALLETLNELDRPTNRGRK